MKPGDLVITRPARADRRVFTSNGWLVGERVGLIIEMEPRPGAVTLLIDGMKIRINSIYLDVLNETR